MGVLISKPGITSASTLSIPKDWSPSWFRNLIENQLKGADVRNAVGSGGISVSGNIASPYATIGFGAAITSPTWIAPAFSANVSYYGSPWSLPGYYKDFTGRVYIRGLITGSGVTNSNPALFTLPASYAPLYNLSFCCFGQTSTSTSGVWRVNVLPNGAVQVDATAPVGATGNPIGYLFLDGIDFQTN